MKTSRSVSGFSRQMSESRVLENLLNLQLGAKVKQPGLVPSNLSLGSKLVLNSGPCPSGVVALLFLFILRHIQRYLGSCDSPVC